MQVALRFMLDCVQLVRSDWTPILLLCLAAFRQTWRDRYVLHGEAHLWAPHILFKLALLRLSLLRWQSSVLLKQSDLLARHKTLHTVCGGRRLLAYLLETKLIVVCLWSTLLVRRLRQLLLFVYIIGLGTSAGRHKLLILRKASIALDFQAQICNILQASTTFVFIESYLSLFLYLVVLVLIFHYCFAKHFLEVNVTELVRRGSILLFERVVPCRAMLQVVCIAELAQFLQLARTDRVRCRAEIAVGWSGVCVMHLYLILF